MKNSGLSVNNAVAIRFRFSKTIGSNPYIHINNLIEAKARILKFYDRKLTLLYIIHVIYLTIELGYINIEPYIIQFGRILA